MLTLYGDFEDFWKAYGKKRGRKKAEAKYNLAIKRVSHEEIIRGHDRYAQYCASNASWYSKQLAATWLHNDGWADEYHIEQDKLDRTQTAAVNGHMRAENPNF